MGIIFAEISLAKGIILVEIILANGTILKLWAAHPYPNFSPEPPVGQIRLSDNTRVNCGATKDYG